MTKKPKALDLAGWRKSQMVVTKNGTRSMTQRELGRKLGVGNSIICRIESGERWPSRELHASIRNLLIIRLGASAEASTKIASIFATQIRTWRAYSPDRKGMTP